MKRQQLKEYRDMLMEASELDMIGKEEEGDLIRQQCRKMELFVNAVEDSMMRRILRMRYMEGLTMNQIGSRVYMDKSTVSRKLELFWKDNDK